MATKLKKGGVLDRLLHRAYKAKDEDQLKEVADEATELFGDDGELAHTDLNEGGETHIHVHADGESEGVRSDTNDEWQAYVEKNDAEHAELFARIEALEAALSGRDMGSEGGGEFDDNDMEESMLDEVPEELQEASKGTQDARYLMGSFRDTAATAEILSPGIKIPTVDSKTDKKQAFKKICGLRRSALDSAFKDDGTRSIILSLNGGRTLDTKRMTCDAIRTLFNSAAMIKQQQNNAGNGKMSFSDHVKNATDQEQPLTIADINRMNQEHWKNRI